MAESATRSAAQPAVVLGLTFLIVGLTFALPYRLVPEDAAAAVSKNLSPEVANVYACAAWAGWAHFLFAFRGQSLGLTSNRDGSVIARAWIFAGSIALSAVALTAVRWVSGTALFSAVVWIYFIDHFLKAESTFEGKGRSSESFLVRWLSSYQPLLTFSWLSVVLLGFGAVAIHPWVLWCVSLSLGAVVLVFGGWRKLAAGDSRGPLLSLFFVAEALVWGTFGSYGGPMFLTGVYVFHIAAGSYFHYFGSYFFAGSRSKDGLLTPMTVMAVNAVLIVLGYLVAYQGSLRWLVPILGVEWFTLWVAVHLVSSDLFPGIRKWRARPVAANNA